MKEEEFLVIDKKMDYLDNLYDRLANIEIVFASLIAGMGVVFQTPILFGLAVFLIAFGLIAVSSLISFKREQVIGKEKLTEFYNMRFKKTGKVL